MTAGRISAGTDDCRKYMYTSGGYTFIATFRTRNGNGYLKPLILIFPVVLKGGFCNSNSKVMFPDSRKPLLPSARRLQGG
ncbi:hypothetical protein NXW58_22315 [Bacteroides faecis]|nr:hypothetical protein NXW58_22315 [Bacteroides faecis]